ncbi:MAG: class I SAM-dependent methyltransferase [bacterium]|nr:class I SAM-dependent methyltransferase [bacterium]
MSCFICQNKYLFRFLNFGNQPPSDAFVRKEDIGKPETKYTLSLYFCGECGLVQLGYAVDPNMLFRDYVYTTGMNNSLRKNFRELVDKIVFRFALGRSDLAIDIGSNDGTLLENYASHNVSTLGVDPSSVAAIAVSKGIKTVRDFWNKGTAERIVKEYGKAKVVTATNVFAHVEDLDSFMRGLQAGLRDDGVFISESGYLLDMVETLGYDAVYHEHLRYYSLKPLTVLFERFGMEMFDVEHIPSHNGSIRVYAARKGAYAKTSSIGELLAQEERKGLHTKETLVQFAKRAYAHRDAFTALLTGIKKSGKRIVGIGAPAKGNTLLNFCGITTETIDCLLEKSELKIGLYAPGTRIPVVSESLLYSERPDFALILSWNLASELMPKLRANGYKGAFIIPFPEPKIVH